MVTSLPNLLTLSRIVVIPLVVALFYVDGPLARWLACALFVAAAITDWFDGHLARTRNQVSAFGRFLDPIADKMLVVSVLFMLTAFDRMGTVAVLSGLVIVLREILVSGLREFLAEIRVGLPVSRLAKWKTGIQMVAIPLLLVGDAAAFMPTKIMGEVGLVLAALLTLVTGWDYLYCGWRHLRTQPLPAGPAK
jgi:cardiolipin synthase